MKKSSLLFGLLGFLILLILISLSIGAHHIPLNKIPKLLIEILDSEPEGDAAILFSIRIPRVLLGVLVGAGLGYSGALIQGLFRNPIAEPGLIGVTSGASVFATGFIVLGASFEFLTSPYSISIVSFVGSLITLTLVYSLSTKYGNTNITTLLLSGIAIASIARSIIGLLVYISSDQQLRNISFWNLGSLGGANWFTLPIIFTFIIPALIFYPFLCKALNAMSLGEREAFHLGINVQFFKKKLIILICLSVGGSIAFTGMIDFVGLISPHLGRMILGADHRYLLPSSALIGGALLVMADLCARTIVAPAELPIGILTSALGAPFFLYLVLKNQREASI
jgi:iron complex transport system permease protein